MWGEIVEKLDEAEQHPDALGAETEDFDDDEDAYDPLKFAEEDDELYPPADQTRHSRAVSGTVANSEEPPAGLVTMCLSRTDPPGRRSTSFSSPRNSSNSSSSPCGVHSSSGLSVRPGPTRP